MSLGRNRCGRRTVEHNCIHLSLEVTRFQNLWDPGGSGDSLLGHLAHGVPPLSSRFFAGGYTSGPNPLLGRTSSLRTDFLALGRLEAKWCGEE